MSTTESASTGTTIEGVEIKGKDVIFLNAPKVILSEETPLLTEAQDVAGAINELKNSLAGGGGDELWQPPADWLEVPEPGPWEANFLVEINENNLTFEIRVSDPKYRDCGYGKITIDWGDGNITNADGGEFYEKEDGSREYTSVNWWASEVLKHTYENSGQYVIKVTTDKFNCLLENIVSDRSNHTWTNDTLLIAKLGENICLETDGTTSYTNSSGSFNDCSKLKWVSIKSNTEFSQYCLNGCYSLKRLDLAYKITKIPYGCFMSCYGFNFSKIDFSGVSIIDTYGFEYCYALDKISLPKCTEIGNYAFQGCYGLTEIYAPLCTSVGNYAFQNCYALEKATFAENCTFGTNAFQNCYNLYPRPDGSTN